MDICMQQEVIHIINYQMDQAHKEKNLVYMRDDSNNLMKDVKEIKTAGNTTTAITNSNGIYVVGENAYAQLLQGNTNTVTRFKK